VPGQIDAPAKAGGYSIFSYYVALGGMVTLCLWVTMQPFVAHGHAKAKRDHATPHVVTAT